MIVIDDPHEADWRDVISDWLVAGGCRYMCAWGLDGTLWDDSVDHANLREFDYGDIPDQKFVMTTWHDNETLEQVLAFAVSCAAEAYDGTPLPDLVVLHVAAEDGTGRLRSLYERVASQFQDC